MKFLYSEGKSKALTFSYDDGQEYDKKLLDIFNKYHLKATFHLNSGMFDGVTERNENFVTTKEVADGLYAGHEIACHGLWHKDLPGLTNQQIITEILEDRKALESLTGKMIQGMSYAYGRYSEKIKELAKSAGIKYSRTVNDTKGFFPPVDFMEWHPTCHHDNNLLELGDKFLDAPGYIELPLMYVWGHSFEFGRSGDWSVMEAFAEKMSGRDDIWYATNMEIYDYLTAIRSLEVSADGSVLYNPTATTVWMRTDKGVEKLAPGETKKI